MLVGFRTKLLITFVGTLCLFSLVIAGGMVVLADTFSADADSFVVGVEDHNEGRDITPVVREAVAYWNANNGEYSAAYRKQFVFKETPSEPDVLVRYQSTVSCADARAGGCAPIPSSEADAERSPKPLVVQLSSTRNTNKLMTKRTLIHEFGHILSVPHCEEPRARMGCPQSTAPTGPTWDNRRYPFNTTALRVYVDATDASATMETEVDRLLGEANAGEIAGVPSAVSFNRVADPWQAHMTIQIVQCSECRGEARFAVTGGPPYSPAIEYLSHVKVTVTAESADGVETWIPSFLGEYSGNESNARRPAP